MANNSKEWDEDDFDSRQRIEEEGKNAIVALQDEMDAINNLLQLMASLQFNVSGSLYQAIKHVD